MVYLVTGSTGLLGRSVCRALTCRGREPVSVIRPGTDAHAIGSSIRVDLADPTWTARDLPAKIDGILHLAQSRRFRDFPDGASDVFGVNIHATARLLDYALAAGATHFIYASSGGLYQRGSAPLTENSPLEPPGELGFYLGSKAAAEVLVQNYASFMKVVILRPFFIYGPGQMRGMLIPRIFDSVKAGRPIKLQGEDGLRINPVHVEDAATAVSKAVDLQTSGVINIAGPEVLSLRDVAISFGEHLGVSPVFARTEAPQDSLLGSIELMTSLLHRPERTLQASIADVDIQA